MIKDDAIGNAYFDKGAAQFFLASLEHDGKLNTEESLEKQTGTAQSSSQGLNAGWFVLYLWLTYKAFAKRVTVL